MPAIVVILRGSPVAPDEYSARVPRRPAVVESPLTMQLRGYERPEPSTCQRLVPAKQVADRREQTAVAVHILGGNGLPIPRGDPLIGSRAVSHDSAVALAPLGGRHAKAREDAVAREIGKRLSTHPGDDHGR